MPIEDHQILLAELAFESWRFAKKHWRIRVTAKAIVEAVVGGHLRSRSPRI